MTLRPEMIDAMIAAGVTREQMAEIIKADILADRAAAEARLASKREATAARVRKHRDAKRNAGNALQPLPGVTSVTAPAAPLDGPPLPPAPPSPPLNPPTTPEPQIPAGSAAPSPPTRRHDWPTNYEAQFWAAYPRHTDRKKAMAALAKVWRQDATPFAEILSGCARLRASNADAAFLPHATTWLNGERWNDELPAAPRPAPRAPPGRQSSADLWASDAIDAHLSRQRGPDDQGPSTDRRDDRIGPSALQRHPRTIDADVGPDGLFGEQPRADPRQLPPLRLVGGMRSDW